VLLAVLDTNVYVAALLSSSGAPARIVRGLADGAFDAVIRPIGLAELRGVLARRKIAERIDPDVAEAFVGWIARTARAGADPADVAPVSPDPGDDYLIALAKESGVSFVVSGDGHLLGLGLREPAVVSPATFAALLDAVEPPAAKR
jgi:predicted nucleic acid-binding protein